MKTQEFDFSVDLMRSILWQYEGAPRHVRLARNDQAYIDSRNGQFWTDWIRDVFDLTTANDFGLAVWSRILDYPITLKSEKRVTGAVFGFGANHENFERGNFGIGEEQETVLGTEEARKLLMLRWFKLTMRPTIPNINRALEIVFGTGEVFVVDSYDMTYVTYMFTRTPNYKLRDLLNRTDALPRPSTVGTKWIVQPRPAFGFGVHHLNFENGNFGVPRDDQNL